MAIGEIIKKARSQKRISIRKLAESVQKSPVVICRIEENQHLPTDKLLQDLCDLLDLDYADLADKREIIAKERDKNGSFFMGTKLVDGHRQHFQGCRCGECGCFKEDYKILNGKKYICKDCFNRLYPDYRDVKIN